MTTEDPLHPSKATVVQKGTDVIDWLLQGPEVWAETKRPFLPPQQIGSAVQIGAMHPETFQHAWIETQRVVAHTAVSLLMAELVAWAKDNRPDFFLTVGQLVEEAVFASDPT